MGSRHNRKRTRSRPRNRLSARASSFNDYEAFSSFSSPLVPSFPVLRQSPDHWHQQYSAWQARLQAERSQSFHHRTLSVDSHGSSEDGLDAQRIRIFGGEAKDEADLCAPMLQVVLDLFEGHIDYEDP